MARSKVPKNLEVDGTSKLAARSKPSDKHEKPELTIEEATIASPRASRKRAGDYFDFDGEGSAGEESSDKANAPKPEKSKKKPKTAAADKTDKSKKNDTEVDGKEKKAKGAKDDTAKAPKEKAAKAVTEKKGKPKEDPVEGTKKAKKDRGKTGLDEAAPTVSAPEAAEKPKGKSKKSKAALPKDTEQHDNAPIDGDVAMDEGPFERLLEHEQGAASDNVAGGPEKNAKAAKGSKSASKAVKDATAPKAKSVKTTAAENAAGMADTAKKGAKDGAEKVKSATEGRVPTFETAAENAAGMADAVKKRAKDGAEKVKNATKGKVPTFETAAEAADALKKEAKAGAEKAKKAAQSKAPSAEKPAEVADAARKEANAATEKAKRVIKPKKDGKTAKENEPIKHKETVKKTPAADDGSKSEASKPKKRKAPSVDADTVKANLLDPLVEHAEGSAKKKQKKDKAKSKSLGGAVGDLLSSAAEGASAAKASLGGLASSLIGAATEAAEGTGDAAGSVAKKAKGKGKAIIDDVAESAGKVVAAFEATEGPEEGDSDSEAEPDDHIAALLAGFESEGDDAPGSGPGFEDGQEVPEIPDAKNTTKKIKDLKADSDEEPGVVYVGRIPHGFHEHQMRQYFSQFGDINRLRLSRNRKTGQSKHFAFIEFKSAAVAKIVANTMDNYLMFGHILKCKVVPPEQLHENVWKGANKRFKTVPWNKLEGRKHEVAMGRDQWNAKVENEGKRRESKKEKLKEIGYEFEAPPLKGVDQVPVKDSSKKPEDGEVFEEEQSLITGAVAEDTGTMVVSEEVKTKKTKKIAKGEVQEATTAAVKKSKRALEAGDEAAGSKAKKAKKAKGAAA